MLSQIGLPNGNHLLWRNKQECRVVSKENRLKLNDGKDFLAGYIVILSDIINNIKAVSNLVSIWFKAASLNGKKDDDKGKNISLYVSRE